jgi:hypothetical protein
MFDGETAVVRRGGRSLRSACGVPVAGADERLVGEVAGGVERFLGAGGLVL